MHENKNVSVGPPKKVSCFWSSVGFKIGAVMHFLFMLLFKCFCNFLVIFFNREIRDTCITLWTKCPIQNMVAKRGITNWENIYTLWGKSNLKHSKAEFQSIQQFWLQLDKVKISNAETRNQRRFFLPYHHNIITGLNLFWPLNC